VGTINWTAVPAASALTFTSGISSVTNVIIQNTFLNSLAGLNLVNAGNITITNNDYMTDITLPLKTVNNGIQIHNHGSSNVNLSQLTTCGSMLLGNVSGLTLSSLSLVTGGIVLGYSSITNFTAESLSNIGQALYLHDNPLLNSLSLQGLISAGSIDIVNNPSLGLINFPQLSTAGNITISGNLSRYGLTKIRNLGS
jgi:hypothetical protein